jgi:hypothetical protein
LPTNKPPQEKDVVSSGSLIPIKAHFHGSVNAPHAGEWNKKDAKNPDTSESGIGVTMLAVCPLNWYAKLQTIITLSSVEAWYVALSIATSYTRLSFLSVSTIWNSIHHCHQNWWSIAGILKKPLNNWSKANKGVVYGRAIL